MTTESVREVFNNNAYEAYKDIFELVRLNTQKTELETQKKSLADGKTTGAIEEQIKKLGADLSTVDAGINSFRQRLGDKKFTVYSQMSLEDLLKEIPSKWIFKIHDRTIIGKISENFLDGPGIVMGPGKEFASGNFYKGLLKGTGKQILSDGTVQEGHFDNGRLLKRGYIDTSSDISAGSAGSAAEKGDSASSSIDLEDDLSQLAKILKQSL